MDTPIMSRCEHLDHDLWTTPSAANVNAAPSKDVLTCSTAIAYVEGKFTEWYGSADGKYKVVDVERIEPISGVRSALVVCVHCRHPRGDVMPFFVWLRDNGKLYGEF